MKLILHHFWKDVRLIRWLLGLWLLIVLVDVILAWLSVQPDFNRAHMAYQIDSSSIFYLAGCVTWVLLLVRLIQSEPMGGTTSFWRTRPTPPLVLIASKILFVALLLVLPSVLLHFLSVSLYRMSGGDMHEIVKDVVVLDCLMVPVLAWLAMQTRNLAHFWIVVCVVIVGFSVYFSVRIAPFNNVPSNPGLTWLRLDVGAFVFYTGLLASLFLQYGLRKTRAAFWTGLVCTGLTFIIATGLPPFMSGFSTFSHRQAVPSLKLPLQLDRKVSPGWSQGDFMGTRYDNLTVSVIPPPPDAHGLAVAHSAGGHFLTDSGQKTTLTNAWHALPLIAPIDWSALVQQMRPDLSVAPTNFQEDQSLCLEVVGNDPAPAKGHRGTLQLEVEGQMQTLQPCGDIPLEGNRFARMPGRTLWITQINQLEGRLNLQIETSGYIKSRGDPFDSLVFVFVNRSAKVGILAQRTGSAVDQSAFFGVGDWGRVSGSVRLGYPPNTLSSDVENRLRQSRLEDWTVEVYEVKSGPPFKASLTTPEMTL